MRTGVLVGLALVLGSAVPAAAQAVELRVVAYNIRHGRGTDEQVDLRRVAEVLRRLDADVIALQEVDDRTERTGGVDQVTVLAELLGYEGRHGPHRPFQGGFYGNAVLTRLPVVSQRTRPIPPASGSPLAVHETIVEAAPGLAVSVVSVHLAGTPEERMAQARAVSGGFDGAAAAVAILAGDFNGRPDDPVVDWLRSSWAIGAKRGDPATYPAAEPDREIDFVMWRARGAAAASADPAPPVRLVDHFVVDERQASDHRPIVADFHLRPPEATSR